VLGISSNAITTRIRLGYPSKDGFRGLSVDAHVPIIAVILGGIIAVAIVWLATSDERQPKKEELDAPKDIALARGSASAS
jgi:hypothetical protein